MGGWGGGGGLFTLRVLRDLVCVCVCDCVIGFRGEGFVGLRIQEIRFEGLGGLEHQVYS